MPSVIILSVVMLIVANKPLMLSVIMLNVVVLRAVMLSVMAPPNALAYFATAVIYARKNVYEIGT
jgi:hypothetical protein